VAAPGADALRARDKELEAARLEKLKSAETEARLRREIEAIGKDRRQLNQQLLDTAARVRGDEAKLAAVEARLAPLDDTERRIRQSLAARQDVIVEVLAALQRIGRRPPPAILVRPEDALQSLRSAILLGALVPELRTEAESLASDLADLIRIRKEIAAERESLQRELADLAQQRQRMALLVEERQKKQAETERALEAERQHAAQLGRQIDSLKELIAQLEQNLDGATRTGRMQPRNADENIPPEQRLAALHDPGRLAPAIAFASARGLLPLPVTGIKIRDFGSADGNGGVDKGLSIATRANAQVTAPCDGWVVYAGPFRSYGQLLILNAGGGYHVLLAGMERISVDLGQFVLTGEPVATMGSGPLVPAAVTSGPSQPVLYVEFRKDGTPIDPSPWWASEVEKVRG
jgi:septal ring factor EnvC (AmiA/AmiB activator)